MAAPSIHAFPDATRLENPLRHNPCGGLVPQGLHEVMTEKWGSVSTKTDGFYALGFEINGVNFAFEGKNYIHGAHDTGTGSRIENTPSRRQ
jgi:hypothetical protein